MQKSWALSMLKNPCVLTLMDSQHVKRSETLHESPRQYFCNISWSLWNEISPTNSVLVVSVILTLFVNILSPDNKYCHSIKGVFKATNAEAIISKSKNIFSTFSAFPEPTSNLTYFENKDEHQRLFLSEIINSKKWGYLNAKTAPCQNTYGQWTC